MSPRTGRPVKEEDKKKCVRLEIRLTIGENELLTELAEKLKLSKTDTILEALRFMTEHTK
jgi:hypothetical protein